MKLLNKLGLLLIALSNMANAEVAVNDAIKTTAVPDGFTQLVRGYESHVDVHFGGKKVGEARVTVRPGYVRFHDPNQLIKLIPNVINSPSLADAISKELPTNSAHLCPIGMSLNCGTISPDPFGVIYDEDQFRVDVFVHPKWLQPIGAEAEMYLPESGAPIGLMTSMGVALSGSSATSPTYNFQNRSIASFRNVRIRSDSSYASKLGFLLDTAAAEVDRPGTRYSAGLFWAPGADLAGQRRILGLGVGTQFDTRLDREELHGTPLIVFLPQPARVDVLVDGRLVRSALYEAGNNVLDMTGMPDGSYPVLLRIQATNGVVREERRSFTKSRQIAPLGKPIYFAYAGMLANARTGRPISVSKDILYHLGTARRMSQALAVDASLIGTAKKPMLQLGGWTITELARFRAAGLVSATGDRAALLQLASGTNSPVSLNIDLRKVWSADDEPLLPISDRIDRLEPVSPMLSQMSEGSYTQGIGSVGYKLGEAYVSVIGSMRKDSGFRADYSVGPNLTWSIINRGGFQVVVHADAQRTRTTSAGYVGIRMMLSAPGYTVSSAAGFRTTVSDNGFASRRARPVVSSAAQYSYRNGDQTELSIGAGLDRDISSTAARAGGNLHTRFGSVQGEILHRLEGANGTQYGLAFQSSAIVTERGLVVGGRNVEQSALVVSVVGTSPKIDFEVIIDGQPRGRVKSGGRFPILLRPYQAYGVRIRPVGAAAISFDAGQREVTLYPGNVQHIAWEVAPLVTVFGRAVRRDGTPVTNALVTTKHGVGHTDDNGYFQVDVIGHESLRFADNEGTHCTVILKDLKVRNDYAAIGKAVCQ